jgi:hypothetical protein
VAARQLRQAIPSLLNTDSDGWVPTEEFEETEKAHRDLFSAMLECALENEDELIINEEGLRELWPFDLEV